MEMCRLKVGAENIEHTDYLESITEEEWKEFWQTKGRKTSPGASGVGPDLWKEAPGWINEWARRAYSAGMRLKVVPDQWLEEVICPISKSGSPVCRTDDLRPIKLLEVSKKAVLSILKARLRLVLENSGILDEAQHGLRPGRGTQTATIAVMSMYERAERNHQPLTGVFLDIKKAYDSVERGAGKAMALRRLGVDEETIEYLVHVDRGNTNWVRTGWEALRKEEGRSQPAEVRVEERYATRCSGIPTLMGSILRHDTIPATEGRSRAIDGDDNCGRSMDRAWADGVRR